MKTIRDTIAIQFMNAILTSERFKDYIDEANIMESIAKDAYKMADTMIEVKGNTSKATISPTISPGINIELTQKQKIVVLLRLIEFIHSSEEITPQDLEFVSTVAETFNISAGSIPLPGLSNSKKD